MPATYSGNPASSTRDLLRYKIGDTDTTSPLLLDAEIDYEVANEDSLDAQVAACFEAIANKLLTQPNFQLDKWREDRGDRAIEYQKKAKELRERSTSGGGVYAGGISKDDKDSYNDDTDRDKPFASMDMDETKETDPLTGEEI